MIKNGARKMMLVALMVFTLCAINITTQAENVSPSTYSYLYYRTPYYNSYTQKDVSTILDNYATGKIDKHNLIMSLIMQCSNCSFSNYDDGSMYVDCYTDYEYSNCVYSISYNTDGYLEITFYDAKYNGTDMSKTTIDKIINSEATKCKNNKRNYTIDKNKTTEMATVNSKWITINNSRILLCMNDSDNTKAPGVISITIL